MALFDAIVISSNVLPDIPVRAPTGEPSKLHPLAWIAPKFTVSGGVADGQEWAPFGEPTLPGALVGLALVGAISYAFYVAWKAILS